LNLLFNVVAHLRPSTPRLSIGQVRIGTSAASSGTQLAPARAVVVAKMAYYKIAAPDEYLAITGMGVKNGE